MRWIVEGIWSGYRASQSRPCHRVIVRNRKTAEAFAKIDTVVFTDGTTMSVPVREAKPREKIQEIHGYTSLLNDFRYRGMTGYCSVSDLIAARQGLH